jgi:galactose oxidase
MRTGFYARISLGVQLAATASLAAIASIALGQPATKGEWGPVIPFPNVPIHVHVLPDGKVLFWGRREWDTSVNPPKPAGDGSLDPRKCTPRIWDPETGTFAATANKPGFNLFCSGHTFLADGRLLVVGGHITDSHGEPRATIYDYTNATDPWKEIDSMGRGRWYPTAVTLSDGRVVVSSGSDEDAAVNDVQQVEDNGHWTSIVDFQGLPLYPRMHVEPGGKVLMSGLNLEQLPDHRFLGTYLLDVQANNGHGEWKRLDAPHRGPQRDYYPSVMFDVGKIIVMGGGNPPLKTADVLDLSKTPLEWKPTDDMHFARRQHNATILADGTVLVTGGTQGGGFNDLHVGAPIRSADLWNPATKHWTLMAKMDVDRCYHSTAVLLPDATVLCAGGGEYRPDDDHPNALKDSHLDAQIFSPPYLFHGLRPQITSAPNQITYGEKFVVDTPNPGDVQAVTWICLSSVTHSFNMTQRFMSLDHEIDNGKLQVTAPANAKVSPPGHYMLFILDGNGSPSKAKILRIK